MVRTYVRKTQRGAGVNYSVEDLEKAVDDVKNGNKTIRGAAVFYNIPRSTVKHRVLGTRGKGFTSIDGKGGGGVKSFLSAAEEEEIVNCLKVMDKNGFGLSRHEVLDLVQLYIRQNNISCRFKDQRPGVDWFIAFRIRHGLSIKKAQSIEHIRCDQINPWVVYDFFEVLTKTLNELNLNGKPERIFNCDETSFCHDPSRTKVVGAIGAKSTRKTSTSGRENTSVLLCCSAAGKMLPLLCVFKGKYVMDNWFDQDNTTQTAVSASSRGWMETTLFFNWFRDVFLPNIGEERPVLLIYDGHTTHISTKLIRLAQQNQVTIMKLPPHTTHLLQPLDVAVFKSLKATWDSELCKWQRANPRKKIPKREFVSLITRLAQEVPKTNIINGFKTTGIFDSEVQGVNKGAIPTSVFKATDLEKYKKKISKPNFVPQEIAPVPQENEKHLAEDTVLLQIPNPSNPSNIMPLKIVDITCTATMSQENVTHSTDGTVPLQTVVSPTHTAPLKVVATHTTTTPQEVDSSLIDQIPSEEASTSTGVSRKSFEELLLNMLIKEKNIETTNKKRKRLVTNCEIITSKEYLVIKENEDKDKMEKEKKKKLKEIAKEKKKELEKVNIFNSDVRNKFKKYVYITDDETSEESDQLSVHDSDDSYNFMNHSDEETDEHDVNSVIQVGEYCVVKVYGKSKQNFRLYVAKVIKQRKAGYNVMFFKRHFQTMKFIETNEEFLCCPKRCSKKAVETN